MAVNVANLGRKPYRSLSADVMASSRTNCACCHAARSSGARRGRQRVVRLGLISQRVEPRAADVTERVLVVSKGRFDRARSVRDREAQGLPHRNSLTSDEFMAATLDVWEMLPERARRVEHPAHSPSSSPSGSSGSTPTRTTHPRPVHGLGLNARGRSRLERRYVGYDLDPAYVAIAVLGWPLRGATRARSNAAPEEGTATSATGGRRRGRHRAARRDGKAARYSPQSS